MYIKLYILKFISIFAEIYNIKIMEALSVSDYRKNLSSAFDRASRGETVLIRRRNQIFTLTNVGQEDLMITPELQAKIDKARKELAEGKTKHFESATEVQNWMDSL